MPVSGADQKTPFVRRWMLERVSARRRQNPNRFSGAYQENIFLRDHFLTKKM